MLIRTNYPNGNYSEHECDMCRRKTIAKEIHKVLERKGKRERKIFDLCNNCYNKVCNSIKTYYDRRKK